MHTHDDERHARGQADDEAEQAGQQADERVDGLAGGRDGDERTRGAHAARSNAGRGRRSPKRPLGQVEEIPVGRVTGLHARRAGSARYIVEVDGVPVATVSVEVIGALGISVGAQVDAARAQQLRAAAGRLEVFDKAIALLAVRARSAHELRLRLRRVGADAEAIAEAVERLTHLGLLNDESFARQLARSRALSGGVSKRRIGQELQRRGVARDVAEDAVAETLTDVGLDEMAVALAAAERRVRALRSYDQRTQERRLYAFLARRGYEAAVVGKVVKMVVSGGGDPDDGET